MLMSPGNGHRDAPVQASIRAIEGIPIMGHFTRLRT